MWGTFTIMKMEDCAALTRTWRVLQRWPCRSSLPVPTLAARGEVGIYHKVTNMCATKQYKEVSKAYLTNTKSIFCEQLSCWEGGVGGVNSK